MLEQQTATLEKQPEGTRDDCLTGDEDDVTETPKA